MTMMKPCDRFRCAGDRGRRLRRVRRSAVRPGTAARGSAAARPAAAVAGNARRRGGRDGLPAAARRARGVAGSAAGAGGGAAGSEWEQLREPAARRAPARERPDRRAAAALVGGATGAARIGGTAGARGGAGGAAGVAGERIGRQRRLRQRRRWRPRRRGAGTATAGSGGGAGTGGSGGSAGGTGTITKTLDIADVWSGHPVGFALVTTATRQYAAYYDTNRTMTVASRALTSDSWTFARLPSTVGWDSHNYIAMDIDSAGFIHVSGNMHAVPLVYFRSTQANNAADLLQRDDGRQQRIELHLPAVLPRHRRQPGLQLPRRLQRQRQPHLQHLRHRHEDLAPAC